jgi:hypothetical protein
MPTPSGMQSTKSTGGGGGRSGQIFLSTLVPGVGYGRNRRFLKKKKKKNESLFDQYRPFAILKPKNRRTESAFGISSWARGGGDADSSRLRAIALSKSPLPLPFLLRVTPCVVLSWGLLEPPSSVDQFFACPPKGARVLDGYTGKPVFSSFSLWVFR